MVGYGEASTLPPLNQGSDFTLCNKGFGVNGKGWSEFYDDFVKGLV